MNELPTSWEKAAVENHRARIKADQCDGSTVSEYLFAELSGYSQERSSIREYSPDE